jgi:hypothetical protein
MRQQCIYHLRHFLLFTTLSVVSLSNIHGQLPTIKPGKGCVLLKHGDVLQGELSPLGSQVSVRLDADNQVYIPIRQVEYTAGSLEEIYKYRVSKMGRLGTGEHYQLVLWCLKQKMNDQAIWHWEELKREIPDDPLVKRLAFQIKESVLQEPWAKELIQQQVQFQQQSQSSGVVTAGGVSARTPNLSGVSSEVSQASSLQKTAPQQIPSQRATSQSTNPTLSAKTDQNSSAVTTANRSEQPQSIRLPSDAQAIGNTNRSPGIAYAPEFSEEGTRNFRAHVQPILIQKCSQAGCHGVQAKNPLTIYRPTEASVRKTAEANIEALRAYIDHTDPMKTRFMRAAMQAHGQQSAPSLGDSDKEAREKIKNWLIGVAQYTHYQNGTLPALAFANGQSPNASPSASTTLQPWQQRLELLKTSAPSSPGENVPGILTGRPDGSEAPVVSVNQLDSNSLQAFQPNLAMEIGKSELDQLDEEIRRAEMAENGGETPPAAPQTSDPFDPNAFNRQYHKQK